jgi:phage recombination protein Bet
MNDLVVFDAEKIALIKNLFCKDATDLEFDLFLTMCKRLQLDPTIKQIYFIKFGGKMSIVVGIDGYRAIADRTGKYMPGRESSFVYDKEGKLFSATSYVKKLGADGVWHEFGATAIRAEYDSNQNNWKKGPHYMLAKCAEALALRKGWPSEFAGTHSEEEMEKAVIDIEAKKPEPVETISIGDAIKITQLIGDDIAYRDRILAYYKVRDFIDVPVTQLGIILEKVQQHNAERLNAELEMK